MKFPVRGFFLTTELRILAIGSRVALKFCRRDSDWHSRLAQAMFARIPKRMVREIHPRREFKKDGPCLPEFQKGWFGKSILVGNSKRMGHVCPNSKKDGSGNPSSSGIQKGWAMFARIPKRMVREIHPRREFTKDGGPAFREKGEHGSRSGSHKVMGCQQTDMQFLPCTMGM